MGGLDSCWVSECRIRELSVCIRFSDAFTLKLLEVEGEILSDMTAALKRASRSSAVCCISFGGGK